MVKTFRMLYLAAAAMVVFAPSAYAAAANPSSFSITPPPIASPTFEAGKSDGKVRFTYLSMEGNGLDFTGGGVDFVGRSAFSNAFAGDIQGGIFVIGGDLGPNTSMTMGNFVFGVNGELQAYKGDTFSAILFAGPNLTLIVGNVTDSTSSSTTSINGNLVGLQAGIQLGINAGDFNIAPFAMVARQSGSLTISNDDFTQTIDIDPYTSTSFGADITYTPWNLSFSAILQEAAKQQDTDKEGMTTHIYQLSWHF